MNEIRHGSPVRNAGESAPSDPPGPPLPPSTRYGETGWSSPSDRPHGTSPWQSSTGTPRPESGRLETAPPENRPSEPATRDTAVLDTAPATARADKRPGRARTLIAGLAIGAILGGGSGAAVALWLDDDAADTSPVQSSLTETNGSANGSAAAPLESVESVAAQVLPSVVSITVGGQFGASGTGTGVVISSDGDILTNNHVVAAGGPGGTLQVTFNDGSTADAQVVGTDPLTDLAVIRAEDVSELTPAALGSSGDLAVGEQVVAIGSPLGLEGTVTSGIISALQRPIITGQQQDSQTFIDAVQTDAPINQGNSGGPLVNMAGEVIGINSAIATSGMDTGSIGLGFSIPIDQARPIAEELIETGTATHARLGIGVDTPREGTRGALIREVEPGGSAEEAGLQEGDTITKIDDRVIPDHVTLIAAARSYRPGDEVTITYLRDGEEGTVQLTLGSDANGT